MSEKTFEKEIKDALVSIDEKIDQIDKKIDENIKKISKQIEQILPMIGKGKEEKKEETREKKTGKESLEAIGERIEQVEKELNKRVKNVPKYLDDSFKKISKQIDQLISQIKEVEKEAESSVKEEEGVEEEGGKKETKIPSREEILDALKDGKIKNSEALELLDQIGKEETDKEKQESIKEKAGKKVDTDEFVKKGKDSIEKALSKLRGRASRLFEQAGEEEKEKTEETATGKEEKSEKEGKKAEDETKMPTREEILDALKEGRITNSEALELIDQTGKEKEA